MRKASSGATGKSTPSTCGAKTEPDAGGGFHELFRGHRAQAGRGLGPVAARGVGGLLADLDGPGARGDCSAAGNAVQDGPMKQAAGARSGEQQRDVRGAGRLAEGCDALRLAAEGPRVLPNPPQAQKLVEYAGLPRAA